VTEAPTLLLVDDDATFRRVMGGELERLGFILLTAESGEEAIRQIERSQPEVILLDLQLPGISGLEVLKRAREISPESETIILTGHGTIDTAIESIRAGAFDYVSKPCPLEELEIRIQRAQERRSLRRRTSVLERGLTPPDPGDWFLGESEKFRDLVGLAHRVAPTDSTVLITGETGSGKEMVAKLLHARSPRQAKPFVVVECAALQDDLLQSELFGHERGAFTGADRAKAGLFEVANGGTIFLDEIGEVSPATQVKLLRVLDASTFRHVGGTAEIHVDVRVLAATNRDLPAMVRQGLFREDLYYRLSTIILTLPPLRERGGDVEILANHFVALLNARHGLQRRLSPESLRLLRLHDWPGNVRELLHAVERAIVVSDGEEILPEDLPKALRSGVASPTDISSSGALPSLEEMERAHIERVLQSVQGHRGSAARILGISERNLYRKLKTYGIS
jgi:DNA-binding NtrC family response regulator